MKTKVSEVVAKRWFTKSIDSITKIGARNDMLKSLYKIKNNGKPPVGEILMYRYSPKLKLKLPYYDTYPLVLVVAFEQDRFYGINLHYLPPTLRTQVMAILIEQKQKSKNQEEYVKAVFPLLQQLSKTLCMFAFKLYLCNHVTSKFIVVEHDYWELVAKLSTEKFVGASSERVWRDAIAKGGTLDLTVVPGAKQ